MRGCKWDRGDHQTDSAKQLGPPAVEAGADQADKAENRCQASWYQGQPERCSDRAARDRMITDAIVGDERPAAIVRGVRKLDNDLSRSDTRGPSQTCWINRHDMSA
jgi:hypothetical protein